MSKKLSATKLIISSPKPLSRSLAKWVVDNQSVLKEKYSAGLSKHSNAVQFAIEVKSKDGATIGFTIRRSGDVVSRLYSSTEKSLKWSTLSEMGCPAFTSK